MELLKTVSREEVDKELTRCPNAEISAKMADVRLIAELRSLLSPFVLTLRAHPSCSPAPAAFIQRIRKAKADMDSLGGTVTCVIRGVPAGLGEPCFDKMEALLAHAMLSIPSTKAFEFGSGFRGTEVPGSRHNDMFACGEDGMLKTITNWSGGVQGGITNGEDIYFRCALASRSSCFKRAAARG
jgi:chorismate synthase